MSEANRDSRRAARDAFIANRRRMGMLPRDKMPPTREPKDGGCGCGGKRRK